MKKISLNITGMHCVSCAANIKLSLEKNKAVKQAKINFANKKAYIEFDENKIDIKQISKIIKATGYEVNDGKSSKHIKHSHMNNDDKKLKFKAFLSIALSAPLILHMFFMWQIPGSFLGVSMTDWVQHDLAFVVVFILGWQFHRNAFKSLMRKQTDMDTLISLGTLSSYFYSVYAMFNSEHVYFEGAATITALILLGRYFETKTKDKANVAMQKLLELGVKNARLILENGKEKEILVENVKIGDILLVKPSEKIPLDGLVIEGSATIDESMLTGESMPILKENGMTVFGATINNDGVIKIKVTKDGENTMLAQIIKTVEEAQNFEAPVQKLADKISSIFVPVVVFISLLTFGTWMMISGNLEMSVFNAVAVLVISCPCALGIATPIAIMVGSSVGAKNGILIKNGESFERAKTIDTIVFDKTGTLTEGKPKVTKIITKHNSELDENKVLSIASSLANLSEHPLSKAVSLHSKNKQITSFSINRFKEIPGIGITGENSSKQKIYLGSIKIFSNYGVDDYWAKNLAEEFKNNGETILYVIEKQKPLGAIFLADTLKKSAREAVKMVKELSIEPIIISGDNEHTVKKIAKEIGVKKYFSEVMPQDKQAHVKQLQKAGKRVIFAGDGINDAPALVQANLGIAMASGTDIAKEAGDIIIMKNEPIKIAEAVKLSQKTFKVIKMNLFWAFFYNTMAIPLAVMGFVSPMLAALAMGLSDITVIGNSLRLYKK